MNSYRLTSIEEPHPMDAVTSKILHHEIVDNKVHGSNVDIAHIDFYAVSVARILDKDSISTSIQTKW